MQARPTVHRERTDPPAIAVIIPVYNHAKTITGVVRRALRLNMPVIVVDDGSTDETPQALACIREVRHLMHTRNRGKGAAITTGFVEALKIADWAITLDADGQHDPEDMLKMIRSIPDHTRPIVVGRRQGMDGYEVPWTSRFGRKFSNFWVFMAGGPRMSDSQSGFRIYPLPESLSLPVKSERFQFEIEILVKAAWKKMTVMECPVSVDYQPGKRRVSHFHPWIDFLRNAATFSRLILQRLFIPPGIRKRR